MQHYKKSTHNNLQKLYKEYPRIAATFEARFWAKTTRNPISGCLEWTGRLGSDGAGRVSFFYRSISASRAAWILTHGDLDMEATIYRTCFNPKCVAIEHLTLDGTLAARLSAERASRIAKAKCDSTETPPQDPTPGGPATNSPRASPARSKFTVTEAFRKRFQAKLKLDTVTGCLEWQGSLKVDGYGQVTVPGSHQWATHRVSWVLANGEIPDGLLVLHKCDNRKCCNPEHLFLGTQSDNIKDMYSKGRGGTSDASRCSGPKLTDEQRVAIATRYSAGESCYKLAMEFGVSPGYVTNLGNRAGSKKPPVRPQGNYSEFENSE